MRKSNILKSDEDESGLLSFMSCSTISSSGLDIRSQIIPEIISHDELLMDYLRSSVKSFEDGFTDDRKSRYQRAAMLLQEWSLDQSGHDETFWPSLKKDLKSSSIKLKKD